MGLKRVRALLEKFYNGETTVEEENVLREYFSHEQIDSEFEADKDIFLYQVHENDNLQELPDISGEIWNNLQQNTSYKYQNNSNIVNLYLRIAASVVVLVGSFFLIKNQVFDKPNEITFQDTYSHPELAYQQAKETLLYVSAMLNNGAGHLEPIQKISEGTEQLTKITTFNKGLNELKPITEYSKVDKYFKP